MTTRRNFLALAAGATASSIIAGPLRAQNAGQGAAQDPHQDAAPAPALTLSADNLSFIKMPADFTGLSYEMPQLYNPSFFSSSNTQLVEAFRRLSRNGVLRIGGNLSDVARWKSQAGDFPTDKQTAAIEHGKTYWEWKLTDQSVRANRDGAITPEAIRNLKGFLDATGWRLLYGLNFGSGSPERAADEAACVAREIGPRLLAFQVGNESDFFGGNRFFRERGFNFDLYLEGYAQFVDAVRQRTPNAPFAGPDTANNMAWVDQFARRAEKPIVLLSNHYYAMGPAKDPAMNADRLLAPNPRLEEQISKAKQAMADAPGVPFRMTEGNSCFGGGKPGVSGAFASALWGADYMLHVACGGYAGVNLHGGGDGFYTPIETLDASIATPRPLFYGMQFANLCAGMDIAQCATPAAEGLNAYVARSPHETRLALINKSLKEVTLTLGAGLPASPWHTEWRLSAPAIDARQGVSLVSNTPASSKPASSKPSSKAKSSGTCVLPPYSAALLVWS